MAEPSLFSPEENARLKIVPLHRLRDGQQADCFALLVDRKSANTRDGKPFYRVTFRDRYREVSQPIWSDSPWFGDCREKWKVGEFYKLRGTYRVDERYGGQLDIEKIRPIRPEDVEDGFKPQDFYESTRYDVDQMFIDLCALVEKEIADVPLRSLVLSILRENEAGIKQIPAASRNHHAFAGGFLEHTLSVTRTCVYLAGKYANYYAEVKPPLNTFVLIAGGVLHDIGKLRELEYRPEGTTYTPEGRLIGHILIGRDLVRAAAESIPDLDPELLLRLEHVIVSHQNLPEWDSPKLPHTPEALIVHYADDLDAKLQMMMRALETETGEEPFTSRQNPMRRHVYRGASDVKTAG
jgi:3'-5' exoribonuclease